MRVFWLGSLTQTTSLFDIYRNGPMVAFIETDGRRRGWFDRLFRYFAIFLQLVAQPLRRTSPGWRILFHEMDQRFRNFNGKQFQRNNFLLLHSQLILVLVYIKSKRLLLLNRLDAKRLSRTSVSFSRQFDTMLLTYRTNRPSPHAHIILPDDSRTINIDSFICCFNPTLDLTHGLAPHIGGCAFSTVIVHPFYNN